MARLGHAFEGRPAGRCLVLAVILTFGLLSLTALHANSAHASDQPGWSVVEASQDYCVNPKQPCSDMAHLGNLGYEEVAAVNFSGAAKGTPDAVVFVCARAYVASNGDIHNLAGHAFVGPTSLGYDGGTPQGTMHVVNDATESSTHAVGTVNVRGTDSVLGTTAEAHGAEVVNSTTDTPLGGHIKVVISGNLEDTNFNTGQTTIVQGTIRCSIHLPYAIGPAPIGQPPDSESVISDADGD